MPAEAVVAEQNYCLKLKYIYICTHERKFLKVLDVFLLFGPVCLQVTCPHNLQRNSSRTILLENKPPLVHDDVSSMHNDDSFYKLQYMCDISFSFWRFVHMARYKILDLWDSRFRCWIKHRVLFPLSSTYFPTSVTTVQMFNTWPQHKANLKKMAAESRLGRRHRHTSESDGDEYLEMLYRSTPCEFEQLSPNSLPGRDKKEKSSASEVSEIYLTKLG